MNFYAGITDYDWFSFLKAQRPDEVNFWRPSAGASFKAIAPGAPFLFKLHKPRHYIAGGGFYSGFVRLPLTSAWDVFGTKNGTADFGTFAAKIRGYQGKKGNTAPDPEIGCVILSNPFFFDQKDWIPAPEDWANSIVQGKTFDAAEKVGARLWAQVSAHLQPSLEQPATTRVAERPGAYLAERPVLGSKYLRTARLGQGAFRALTLENYQRHCCVTGENTVPVLQAAHIRPVAQSGNHALTNGLLLRADLHILYDKGLIGVSPDYKIRVSPQIREQFLNGKVYYSHDGQPLRSLPADPELRPDRDLLDWHMTQVFVGA